MDAWYLEARRGLRSVERARLLERRQLARRAVVGVHRHAAHRRLGRSLPDHLVARITPNGVGSGRLLAIKIAGRPAAAPAGLSATNQPNSYLACVRHAG